MSTNISPRYSDVVVSHMRVRDLEEECETDACAIEIIAKEIKKNQPKLVAPEAAPIHNFVEDLFNVASILRRV